jgi:hypothetical protein
LVPIASRSGSAIDFAIHGIDHALITKIDKWSSHIYLRYSPSKAKSHGLFTTMARAFTALVDIIAKSVP